MSLNKTICSILFLASTACQSIKPYEKEYLVHPLMDDGLVRRMDERLMMSQCQTVERLGNAVGTGIGGTSCPTCGG
jgi:hypothetical protein